jgi:hypothetical protein
VFGGTDIGYKKCLHYFRSKSEGRKLTQKLGNVSLPSVTAPRSRWYLSKLSVHIDHRNTGKQHIGKGKGNVHPRTGHEGPEGE